MTGNSTMSKSLFCILTGLPGGKSMLDLEQTQAISLDRCVPCS